ncbi:MAG: hypothetical protein ABIE84_05225 [bacterium]
MNIQRLTSGMMNKPTLMAYKRELLAFSAQVEERKADVRRLSRGDYPELVTAAVQWNAIRRQLEIIDYNKTHVRAYCDCQIAREDPAGKIGYLLYEVLPFCMIAISISLSSTMMRDDIFAKWGEQSVFCRYDRDSLAKDQEEFSDVKKQADCVRAEFARNDIKENAQALGQLIDGGNKVKAQLDVLYARHEETRGGGLGDSNSAHFGLSLGMARIGMTILLGQVQRAKASLSQETSTVA